MTFSQRQLGFTSLEDDASEIGEVSPDGSRAAADLTLSGPEDTSLEIDVTFRCRD